MKAGTAALLFPLTWGVLIAAAGLALGTGGALVAAVLGPASGYSALRARESLDLLVGRGRALFFAVARGPAIRRLVAERGAIHEEILQLGRELELVGAAPQA
jgi:hypothetical protein